MGTATQFALEPVAAPLANEIAEIEKVRDGINRYMGAEIEDEAKELLASTEGITVAGHTEGPKAGREAVHSALMRLVKFRTQIVDGAHESYKKPINALASLLDGRKRALTQMLAVREAALKADRDAFDRVEKEQKEAAAKAAKAEADRKEAEAAAEVKRVLQARIQRLMDLGAVPNVVQIATATDAEFEAIVAAAAEAQAVKLAQQEDERQERERLAAEQRECSERIAARAAEASRAGILPWWSRLDDLAFMTEDEFRGELAERIEAKALAAQDAERMRVEAEEAEAKRKRDQEAEDARRAAEQSRMDAERAALDAERARLDAEREAREAAEREAEAANRSAQAVEDARQAAEAQRITDEARAVAEAARIEAERPDREKAWKWLDKLDQVVAVPLVDIQGDEVRDRFCNAVTSIYNAIQLAKREFQP